MLLIEFKGLTKKLVDTRVMEVGRKNTTLEKKEVEEVKDSVVIAIKNKYA